MTHQELLTKYWGYAEFKPLQLEVIESVMDGHDVVALMPTGGGKSLTYQIPALAMDGICIVVTPLIALMKDQVDALRRRGILATWLHSAMSSKDIDRVLDNCVYGDYKFLYVSPERLQSDVFRIRMMKMNVSLIAVDEAHCISEWGYDFRPSYLNIYKIRELAPDARVLALTASATESVVGEIVDHLKMIDPKIFRMSFLRSNISYVVRHSEDKLGVLLRVINSVVGSGIVYVRTRMRTETIAQFLVEQGVTALPYHGGMITQDRNKHQESWIRGETRVIVATNAFGMGIDKADVRFVIHLDICDSLESYYQESGRAGRDGKSAYAVLISSSIDALSCQRRVDLEFPPIEKIKTIYDQVFQWLKIPYGEGKDSSYLFNIYEFAAHYKYFIPLVVNALKILNLGGYLTLIEEMDNPTRIQFVVSREQLYHVKISTPELDRFLGILLRNSPGVFSDFVAISESYLASLLEITTQQISGFLIQLSRDGVLKYIPGAKSPVLHFDEERLPMENIYISPMSYSRRKEVVKARASAMFNYAQSVDGCRSLMLQNYFGDKSTEVCGCCDLCRDTERKRKSVVPQQVVLSVLAESCCTIPELVKKVGGDREVALSLIKKMIGSGNLRQNSDGTITVSNM